MATFGPAFDKMIRNEGGFKLTNIEGDRGGQTYAGIARNAHPDWSGWRFVDAGDLTQVELTQSVRDFYRREFWNRIGGDAITHQTIAETLFDFAVNAGSGTAAKLAQIVVGVVPDGGIGPRTLAALNGCDPELFALKYALAKVSRYAEICNRDRTQSKFLLGWINRTLKELT
jgi:lysozyme family protein